MILKNKIYEYSLLFFVFLIYLFLVINSDQNFDLKDESFYVLSAAYPHDILGGFSQFGYINHFFFKIFNFNIVNFRIFGIIILFLSSLYFSYSLSVFIQKKFNFHLNKIEICCLFSVCILLFYKHWLLTPSYNFISLVCILILFGTVFFF